MRNKQSFIFWLDNSNGMFPRESNIDDQIVLMNTIHCVNIKNFLGRHIFLKCTFCMAINTNTPISFSWCGDRIQII